MLRAEDYSFLRKPEVKCSAHALFDPCKLSGYQAF